MDFKGAEAIEYNAYSQRYNHLALIATDKDCEVEVEEFPTIDDIKKSVDKAKEKK